MVDLKHITPLNQEAVLNSETVDRISGLPDKLLCHILAFLPTRCVVATCILSKRWKYVWTHVPVLDFTDLPSSMTNSDIVFNQEQYVSFKNYASRILLLNDVHCLKRVYFEAYEGISLIALPSTFLIAKEKLVVLKLDGPFELYLPSSIHLPCLQSLSLVKVVFPNEHNQLSILLSSCPVLEELNIEYCEGFEKLSVSSSSVKKLGIYSTNNKKEDIIVETPNVEVLYLSMGIKESVRNDMSSLVDTRLNIWTSSAIWTKLLQRIQYTKILILHQIILDDASDPIQLPVFQNLTNLKLGFCSWKIILQILSHAPKLVSFFIHKLMFDWPGVKPEKKELPLERIKYYDFNVEEDFEVVRYFLSNSLVLKKFNICTSNSLDLMTENGILKELLKMPRSSNICEIAVISGNRSCKSECSDSESEGSESDNSTS